MTKFQVGDKVEVLEPRRIFACKADEPFVTEVVEGEVEDRVYILDIDDKPLILRINEMQFIKKYKPTKNQRISALEKEVAELKKVVEGLKPNSKNTIRIEVDTTKLLDSINKATPKHSSLPQSNNQKRAAIIEKAKRFVEERQAVRAGDEDNQDRMSGNSTARNCWYETEFFVKDGKVTALVYWLQLGKKRTLSPKEIGRSKCHPHDVFNEHIGKAIALGRALGLDVSEFEQAVQPDEVVVGMETEHYGLDRESLGIYKVDEILKGNGIVEIRDLKRHKYHHLAHVTFDKETNDRITNDTNAQYEEVK